MSILDVRYKSVAKFIQKHGSVRDTRTGEVKCSFNTPHIFYDMRNGFSILTSKQVYMKGVCGELLWFLGGHNDLSSLRGKTFGVDEGQRTIWDDDFKRWSEERGMIENADCGGRIYGVQWRNSVGYSGVPVDQIKNLVEGIKRDPYSRYHIVQAWNPADIAQGLMALPPCHMMFQVDIDDGQWLDLKFYQRSVDLFLGEPYNLASYGLLMHILGRLTGYKPRYLTAMFGNVQIYKDHTEQMERLIGNEHYDAPKLILPDSFETLEELERLTAVDFGKFFPIYNNAGVIKAPLIVSK